MKRIPKTNVSVALARTAALLVLGGWLASSCRRQDIRTARIDVPDMTNEVAIALVRNAVSYELHHRRNDSNFQVDTNASGVAYTGGPSLKSAELHARIDAALREAGLQGKVAAVRPIPVDNWNERHAILVSVNGLRDTRTANVAIAAIAEAMWGRSTDGIALDTTNRTVTIVYDSLEMSLKNFEHAIANAGLRANDIPPLLNSPDALPQH